jgi:cyanophycinase-like exopeptidase
MAQGYLIFSGGDAFSPRSRNADYTWLKLMRGNNRHPRVAVVPVAAMRKAEKNAQDTTRYFQHLRTIPEYTLILDRNSANRPTEYELLDKVEVIVLIDGSPIDMVERLRGTKTEEVLHGALEREAAIMATGASAMALGAVYWFAHEWEAGLGLAPHLAILPHHNLIRMRLPPEKLLADLPEGITLVGVDDATVLISHPDGSFEVAGEGTVTVYRSVDQLDTYRDGGTFRLEPAS